MKGGKYNIIYTQFVQCLWMGILVLNMFSYKDSFGKDVVKDKKPFYEKKNSI